MSRFDATRRGRIAVWTGAALAWGTALTLAGQEPVQAGTDSAEPPTSVETENTVVGSIPTLPDQGLVIIRYQPSVASAPEVRTVYVQQAAPQAPTRSAAPTAAPASAPAPKSSGS
ncbi:MAG: hypothetical protein PVJ28_05880 [Acidimicrobiia bacterium]|jgi:hypothetical protein